MIQKKGLDFNDSMRVFLAIFPNFTTRMTIQITHQHRFSAACIFTACTQCLQRSPLGASLREVGENLGDFSMFFFHGQQMDQTLLVNQRTPPPRNSRPPYDQGFWKPIGFPSSKTLKKSLFLGGGGYFREVGWTDQAKPLGEKTSLNSTHWHMHGTGTVWYIYLHWSHNHQLLTIYPLVN